MFDSKTVRGVSLIETVVTIGVVILLITGLVVGMTSSLQNAQASKARSLAVQYTEEALELVRQERDLDWATFASRDTSSTGSGTDYCMGSSGQLSFPSGGSCPPFIGSFSRLATYTKNAVDPGQVDVVVTVSWPEGSGTKNITIKTTYTLWK